MSFEESAWEREDEEIKSLSLKCAALKEIIDISLREQTHLKSLLTECLPWLEQRVGKNSLSEKVREALKP